MVWRRRRKQPEPGADPQRPAMAPAYRLWREDVLALGAGGRPQPTTRVCRVALETGYEGGHALVAASAGGAVEAMMSWNAALLSSDRDARVTEAVERVLLASEESLDLVPAARAVRAPPEPGRVQISVLTLDGRHTIDLPEDDLGLGTHGLSAVFYASHEAYRRLRLVHLERDPDGDAVAFSYSPRWTEREIPGSQHGPVAPDEVYAELERRGVRQAIVSFSGGNDEGGADEIAFVRDGHEVDTFKDGWSGDSGGEDEALADALERPLHEAMGFAGAFVVHGTIAWDTVTRRIVLRSSTMGEDDELAAGW